MQIVSRNYLINQVQQQDITRVGIWRNGINSTVVTNILSSLHIGTPGLVNNNGHRDWMDVGTYMNIPGGGGADNMYVGLRSYANDITNAVINWGDNPTTTGVPDRLIFVYTETAGPNQASTYNGLEAGRMRSNGNRTFTGFGGDPYNGNFYSTGSIDPQNTLEINSPLVGLSPTSSGLRFTDMNSTLIPVVNPGLGVLTVDSMGDVIYVPGGAGGSYFACNNPQANMTFDSRFNLNNFNFYFEGNASGNTTDNSVLIGKTCSTAPLGKLDVLQNSQDPNGGTVGIYVENNDNSNTNTTFGIKCFVPGVFNNQSLGYTGITATVSGEKDNTAIEGIANGLNTTNIGGRFFAINGSNNFGIVASVFGINPPNEYAGLFNGDLNVNGNYYQNNALFTSDQNLKQNINPITNSLSIINQLQPKSYYYDTIQYSGLKLTPKKQYGLIAQSVEGILPELVTTKIMPPTIDTAGNIITSTQQIKYLNYNSFFGILIAGIQEQQQLIDSLFDIVNNNNVRPNNSTANNIDVDLVSDIVLYQNMPNPFGESTIIKYYLPSNITSAVMNFMDETGRIIKEVQLTQTGDGQITINAQDLASGIYTYSLYVNGQNVQTRKMQKVK